MRAAGWPVATVLAGLLSATSVQALGSGLPLVAGDYAAAGYTCATAPFAALMHFDGRSYSGPHESRCVSVTREHRGSSYLVSTTCSALGDGTPAAPSTVTWRYDLLSSTRVTLSPAVGRGAEVTYSRCDQPVH